MQTANQNLPRLYEAIIYGWWDALNLVSAPLSKPTPYPEHNHSNKPDLGRERGGAAQENMNESFSTQTGQIPLSLSPF